jgi:hypothetical protein
VKNALAAATQTLPPCAVQADRALTDYWVQIEHVYPWEDPAQDPRIQYLARQADDAIALLIRPHY